MVVLRGVKNLCAAGLQTLGKQLAENYKPALSKGHSLHGITRNGPVCLFEKQEIDRAREASGKRAGAEGRRRGREGGRGEGGAIPQNHKKCSTK